MKISTLFDRKKAVFSFEIFPPKPTAELGGIAATVDRLAALAPDYISVTCSAGGSGNARTEEIAALVKRAGVEPLAHVTCLHADRDGLRRTLDGLADAGVENVLALRGDRIEGMRESGEFSHASDLVRFIRENGYPFDVAGACYPEGHPESKDAASDIRMLKVKVDAGVTHLNTQLFFDNEDFFGFLRRASDAGIGVPVQAGVMPLVKKNHIDRIITLSGAKIPAKISRMIARFYDAPDALAEAGTAYAVDQIIDLLSGGARGAHVYVMNNAAVAERIAAGVLPVIREINGENHGH